MPPKKASKIVAKASDTKSGAKTSSAKSASAPKQSAAAGKKKPTARSKKTQQRTEKPEAVSDDEDEENGADKVAKEKDTSSESGELWELTIKTMRGNFTVRVPPTAGVMDLKEKIFESQGVPAEYQRLMFNSKIFTDDHPLTVYDVANGSEIYFVLRMCGV